MWATWGRGDTVRTAVAVVGAAALIALAFWLHGAPGRGPSASFSLLAGTGLGLLMERGRFCFFCIFRDFVEDRDSTGLYGVLAALAVGGVGYALVFGVFLPDPSGDRLPPTAHISPISPALVAGGLAFGLGMALSGACISGHLYRLGQGYLRALPALAGTIVGFGLGFASWNWLYRTWIGGAPVPWLPRQLGYGWSVLLHLGVLAAIAAGLLRWLRPAAVRPAEPITAAVVHRRLVVDRWPVLLTGAAVGVIGVFAYLRVEPLGVTAQLSSFTRTELTERGELPERLLGLDVLRGCVAVLSETITDNGWLIVGLVVASFLAALAGNRVSAQVPTVRNSASALAGGVLMGWGAMVSLGCTVGVLLSGTQAFAPSGWVFAVTTFVGTAIGIRLRLHRL